MNNVSQFVKENRTFFTLLIICIGLLIVFVLTAMFSGAWPSPSISGQILSALAGAVVAAMITLFLLLGQTSSEEKKERNSKVFEEKLKIYQDFLKCMCEVIEDRKVTPEEAIRLEFQTSYITMHTDSEHIKDIAIHVNSIVDSLSEKNTAVNRAENESESNVALMESLFKIVNIFREELYRISPTKKDENNNKEAAKSFSKIMEAVEVPSKNEKTPDDNLKQNIKDFTSELLKSINVNREFWDEVNTDESNENGTYIRLTNKVNSRKSTCVPRHRKMRPFVRYSISREVPRSILKCETVLGTLDATPKVPRHTRLTQGEHRGSRHHFI